MGFSFKVVPARSFFKGAASPQIYKAAAAAARGLQGGREPPCIAAKV